MFIRGFQWLAIATLAAGVAGCNREEPTVTQTDTPAQQTSVQRDDSWIETAVQAKYYDDDSVRGRSIAVDANGGAVTLRGVVETEQARQQAVALARSVEGVTAVNDELRVGATTAESRPGSADTVGTAGREDGRTPGWITTKIQAQYFVNPEIKPWNIDVTTNSDGVVILEGVVEEANDKTEAVRIARETEGVTRVEDRLRLQAEEGETERRADRPAARTGMDTPDGWVTAKIQAKYFIDDEVKARNIDVDTNDGHVTLNGTVATEAERRQALALARNTNGVRDVTDRLTIDKTADPSLTESARSGMQGAARQAERAIAEVERPDAWLTTKVQAKYFLDADVKGHRIDVDTRNGVVTLTGSVETAQQKTEAEKIARDTEGVKRVVNQLTVGKK
ncbi:MAG: BON domain-containing protein [Vicinamibacterales bacterium]